MGAKSINFLVSLEVYPFDIMVSMGQTDTQLRQSLNKYRWPDNSIKEIEEDVMGMSNTVQGRTMMLSCNRTILRMAEIPFSTRDYGYLSHEIFHAVSFILDRVGIKFELCKSDEAYAYLISYVTEKIYDRLS